MKIRQTAMLLVHFKSLFMSLCREENLRFLLPFSDHTKRHNLKASHVKDVTVKSSLHSSFIGGSLKWGEEETSPWVGSRHSFNI
jgi:hypothetical protein